MPPFGPFVFREPSAAFCAMKGYLERLSAMPLDHDRNKYLHVLFWRKFSLGIDHRRACVPATFVTFNLDQIMAATDCRKKKPRGEIDAGLQSNGLQTDHRGDISAR
jgi:hypothetical protein